MNIKHEEIAALLKRYNSKNMNRYTYEVTPEDFIDHAKRYIKATKEGRMVCSIGSVSSSGMSRTMKFVEMAKNTYTPNKFQLLNFYQFFDILGHTKVRGSDYFRVSGCGMDMVFATNYNIIRELHGLGLLNKPSCRKLEQETPPVL